MDVCIYLLYGGVGIALVFIALLDWWMWRQSALSFPKQYGEPQKMLKKYNHPEMNED